MEWYSTDQDAMANSGVIKGKRKDLVRIRLEFAGRGLSLFAVCYAVIFGRCEFNCGWWWLDDTLLRATKLGLNRNTI